MFCVMKKKGKNLSSSMEVFQKDSKAREKSNTKIISLNMNKMCEMKLTRKNIRKNDYFVCFSSVSNGVLEIKLVST